MQMPLVRVALLKQFFQQNSFDHANATRASDSFKAVLQINFFWTNSLWTMQIPLVRVTILNVSVQPTDRFV